VEPLVGVDTLRAHWRAAFDAADSALRCAAGYLPPEEVRDEVNRLDAEREPTTELLARSHAIATSTCRSRR